MWVFALAEEAAQLRHSVFQSIHWNTLQCYTRVRFGSMYRALFRWKIGNSEVAHDSSCLFVQRWPGLTCHC